MQEFEVRGRRYLAELDALMDAAKLDGPARARAIQQGFRVLHREFTMAETVADHAVYNMGVLRRSDPDMDRRLLISVFHRLATESLDKDSLAWLFGELCMRLFERGDPGDELAEDRAALHVERWTGGLQGSKTD